MEECRDEGRTVGEIVCALHLNKNQHWHILYVIVRIHHAILIGAKYDSMGEFCAGSVPIKPVIGLSYTKTTLLINW